MSATGYKRVYSRFGSYYFVDTGGKWHRLTPVADGEPAMLRALAKHQTGPLGAPGTMPALIAAWRADKLPGYAESTRDEYDRMLRVIEASARDVPVAELDAGHVLDLRDQWIDRPRAANAYHSLLSLLMSHAILLRLRTTNPCGDVKKLRVPKRRRVMSDAEQVSIADGALRGRRGWRNANGAMYAALFEFAYLTALRAKDVRLLQWADVQDGEIVVQPTKTRDSTGKTIAIQITPAIDALLDRARALGKVKSLYVFHTLRGGALSASAVKSAWRRARERAGVKDARFRDLRPKAITDASRAGLSIERIRDAAAHENVATTEGYVRRSEVVKVDLGLNLPGKKRA